MKDKDNKDRLVIYQGPAGSLELKADTEKETIWATLNQIAALFETDKSGVSRHINNILKTRELNDSTVANFATVQNEGGRAVSRLIEYFDLQKKKDQIELAGLYTQAEKVRGQIREIESGRGLTPLGKQLLQSNEETEKQKVQLAELNSQLGEISVKIEELKVKMKARRFVFSGEVYLRQ
jgi:hypothetical protein